MARRTIKIRWGRWEDTPGGRQYVRYAPGDPVELSDEEAAGFPPGRLGPPLKTARERLARTFDDKPAGALVLTGNVREVAARIEQLSGVSQLIRLAEIERESERPRKGVLSAIELRLAQLGAESAAAASASAAEPSEEEAPEG